MSGPAHRQLDVLVVGGGIGGLAAGVSIARAGRQVHVVEQAPEFGEIGAGLQLGPNALRAFDSLGVDDAVAASALFPARGVVRNALDGTLLTTVDFGEPFVRRFGYPYVSRTAAMFSTPCSRLVVRTRGSSSRTAARRWRFATAPMGPW